MFQAWQLGRTNPQPPDEVVTASFVLIGMVALGNLLIMLALRRVAAEHDARRLGMFAFAMDSLILTGFVWLGSYNPNDIGWVLMYLIPLQGALRYQMRGALWSLSFIATSEAAREAFRVATLESYDFVLGRSTFVVGIAALIALVAGYMSRSLATMATQAREQARREIAARKELAAFHHAVMAGVAAADLEASLQSMVEAIGTELDLETLSIGIIEDGHLRFGAVFGLPAETRTRRLRPGEGVTGRAWAEDRGILVEDVHTDPGYIEVDPSVCSEIAVPLRVGGEVIGVLDVESRRPGRLTTRTLDFMTRLADQVALVMNNAAALSRQREALVKLRELDDMKSDFVAITSHELRTPLTAIRGFIETLKRHSDKLSPEERQHFLDVIDGQSRKLSRLLEDLLVVSKLEAGHMSIDAEDVAITAVMEDLVSTFDAQSGRIRLDVRADGVVRLDPHRLSQVLRNLVGNALKYSPVEGLVEIEVDRPDGRVRFAVRDQGPGIAEPERERIFDRFHQTGKREHDEEGAGLGLYISKRLVQAMGGEISVGSGPDGGAEFVVSLPQGGVPPGPPPPPGSTRSD